MTDEESKTKEPAPEDRDASPIARDDSPSKKKTDWGFPAFATDFPAHPELDRLVAAFSDGDYATVREGAPKLAASTDDEEVKAAATLLRSRIEPDPTARIFFGLTAALLVFLSIYWMTHDGKTHENPKEPPPKVEIVK